jgi:hypothetical protein
MEIRAGFILVAEDIEAAWADLSDAAPAAMVPIDQETYVEAGEPFEKGERVGEAHGSAMLTHSDKFVVHLTFEFLQNEEDSVTAHGVLPREGGQIGRGRIAITGGTGRFHKASGRIEVQTRNPKRYIFNL